MLESLVLNCNDHFKALELIYDFIEKHWDAMEKYWPTDDGVYIGKPFKGKFDYYYSDHNPVIFWINAYNDDD